MTQPIISFTTYHHLIIPDKGMGLCFANVVDGICKGSLKKMDKVGQPECCCTGGGQAWGPNCAACPAVGSGMF